MTERTIKSSEELQWLFDNRRDLQATLFQLFKQNESLLTDDRSADFWAINGLLVGIGFSLWRAVFLSLPLREPKEEYEDAQRLLEFVIDTHIINFPQDRASQQWMGGYYNNGAILRLSALLHVPEAKKILEKFARGDELDRLKKFDPQEQSRFGKMNPRDQWEECNQAFKMVVGVMGQAIGCPS
jgi:hypothetical protein